MLTLCDLVLELYIRWKVTHVFPLFLAHRLGGAVEDKQSKDQVSHVDLATFLFLSFFFIFANTLGLKQPLRDNQTCVETNNYNYFLSSGKGLHCFCCF